MSLPDGLYRVDYKQICAGFAIEGGKVVWCAPVLRAKFSWWCTIAKRIA